MVRGQDVTAEVARGDIAHTAALDAGLQDLVAGEVGAAERLVAPLQQALRARAGHRRREGPHEDHAGRNARPDAFGDGRILQAEHLGQDHGVLVLEQDADLLHGLLPELVHRARDLHRAQLAGAHPHRRVHDLSRRDDTAGDALVAQPVREEGGEEVLVVLEIDDQHLACEFRLVQQAHVVERERCRPEGAEGHQPHARAIVQGDARPGKEAHDALRRLFEALEGAGEEVQGVLPRAHDGGAAPGLLQADACSQSGESAAYDHGVESHKPRTCL